MSIINDAIKKARRDFEIRKRGPTKKASVEITGVSPESSETKWTVIIIISLALIASLLGALFLYKYIPRLNIIYKSNISGAKRRTLPTIGQATNDNISPSGVITGGTTKLNGIVYGPEAKWAIINDKIVREGEYIPAGKLTVIAKDFVKIEKDDGEELILNLR